MIFIKANNLASAELRCDQIAREIGATVYMNTLPMDVSGTCVFVKGIDYKLAKFAKSRGCKVVYDPIDQFAYADRVNHNLSEVVDVVIAYSQYQADYFRDGWFKDSVVIPHQWDSRLEGKCLHDSFNPAYIGYEFNWKSRYPLTLVTDPAKMLESIPKYNCHVSLREPGTLEAKYKPATKVVSAAAVGAIIITTPDKSALELLPKDYPYWCPTIADFPEVLEMARADFNGHVWDKAIGIMDKVRETTSLKNIAKLYIARLHN